MKRLLLRRSFVVLLRAVMLLCLTQAAARAQSVQTFTSLSSWQAAVNGSPQVTATFQDITQPVYFQTAPAQFGLFSFQQVGQDPTFGLFRNFIDVPPLQFTDNSGVTYAALFTKLNVTTVDLTFAKPVYAWGANFYSAQTGELENLVLNRSGGGVIATVPVTVNTGFFGFVVSSETGLSGITFTSRIANPDPAVGQGVGLENLISALTSPLTPVPSSNVKVTASGLSYSRLTQTFNGTITITNISKTSIPGPFEIAFSSLPNGVMLNGTAGTYNGSPYMNFSTATLAAGQAVTIPVRLTNPSNATITLSPVLYSGGL